MKYIRTKDGRIVDVSNVVLQDGLTIKDIKDISEETRFIACYDGIEIVKYSDTVEELCDEFVIYDIHKDKWLHFTNLNSLLGYCGENGLDKTTIRGAIWTDKGLIYKAKMKGVLPNGEIDWELL